MLGNRFVAVSEAYSHLTICTKILSRAKDSYNGAQMLYDQGQADFAAPVSYTHLDVYKRQLVDMIKPREQKLVATCY